MTTRRGLFGLFAGAVAAPVIAKASPVPTHVSDTLVIDSSKGLPSYTYHYSWSTEGVVSCSVRDADG